ncbi:MAG: hypothetical protein ACYDA6_10335, partial [Solirubrobacteraceae bacterium]
MRGPARSAQRAGHVAGTLAMYASPDGQLHEVVSLPGAAGSTLVVDRDAVSGGDPRLVAHLACDEPPENARVVCRHYLHDLHRGRGRCRPVAKGDLGAQIGPEGEDSASPADSALAGAVVTDGKGRRYRIAMVPRSLSSRELRWTALGAENPDAGTAPACPSRAVSLRDVIAAAERYEPMRAITVAALRVHQGTPGVSLCLLRSELRRMDASPVVLNRGLREAVLASIAGTGLTMNEIAIRCGRVKRCARGHIGGETSWLARRLGL